MAEVGKEANSAHPTTLLTGGKNTLRSWAVDSESRVIETGCIDWAQADTATFVPLSTGQVACGVFNRIDIASCHADGSLTRGAALGGLQGLMRAICELTHLRLAAADDRCIRVWGIRADALWPSLQHIHHYALDCRAMALLPSGLLAIGDAEGVAVWDLESRVARHTWKTPLVHALTVAGDGRLLVAALGKADPCLATWDWKEQEEVPLAKHPPPASTCFSLLPVAGSHLAALKTSSKSALLFTPGQEGGVALLGMKGSLSGAISLPGGRVATSSQDKALRVWDTLSGRLLCTTNRAIKVGRGFPLSMVHPYTHPYGLLRGLRLLCRWKMLLWRAATRARRRQAARHAYSTVR